MTAASGTRRDATPQHRTLVERVISSVVVPSLAPWFKETWGGLSHVPATGPVVVAGNHLSHADVLALGRFLVAGRGRFPRFLGKAEVFAVPVLGSIARRAGQIPVHRGTANAADSFASAQAALERGELVVLLPEGTFTRDPHFWPMTGKTGAARLALASGAPLVPVAIWGTERILPPRRFDWRVARHALRPAHPVTVVAGAPVDLDDLRTLAVTTSTLVEATARLMAAVTALLAQVRGEDPQEPPMNNPRVVSRTHTRGGLVRTLRERRRP